MGSEGSQNSKVIGKYMLLLRIILIILNKTNHIRTITEFAREPDTGRKELCDGVRAA